MTGSTPATYAAIAAIINQRLIVSCQAPSSDPLSGPDVIARMAHSVALAGAAAVRVEGLDDIRAVRAAVSCPVVGLVKVPHGSVYITPTVAIAHDVARTGVDIVAVDATARPRPDGSTTVDIFESVHAAGALVMADVSTFDEGMAAAEHGADFVATTLAGYIDAADIPSGPDLGLVHRLAAELPGRVIAEGRIDSPERAAVALANGALAVVVGTAITRPSAIAQRFIEEMVRRGTTRI